MMSMPALRLFAGGKKKLECYFLTHGDFLHFSRLSFYFEVEFLQNETSVYCMSVRIKRDRDYHKQ